MEMVVQLAIILVSGPRCCILMKYRAAIPYETPNTHTNNLLMAENGALFVADSNVVWLLPRCCANRGVGNNSFMAAIANLVYCYWFCCT